MKLVVVVSDSGAASLPPAAMDEDIHQEIRSATVLNIKRADRWPPATSCSSGSMATNVMPQRVTRSSRRSTKRRIGIVHSWMSVASVMAFSEVDLKRIEQTVGVFCVKHSPAHLKDKLSLVYAVKGHEVVIIERRP